MITGETKDCVSFQEASGLFTLRTKNTMYQMQAGNHGFLFHLYYGPDLGDADTADRIVLLDRGYCPNPFDVFPDRTFSPDALPLEYSAWGCGDYRTPALEVTAGKDGSRAADLRYDGYEILPGKYGLTGLPAMFGEEKDAMTLAVTLRDAVIGLKVTLLYGVFPELDIITRAVRITNESSGEDAGAPLYLEKAMSMSMDIMPRDLEMVHFHGRHTMERMPQRSALAHGRLSVGSTRGSSSHQHNPFVILCDRDTTEDFGLCWGYSFVYSGNFICEAEVDQLNQTRVVMGIHPRQFRWKLSQGETFETPEVILCCSAEGFSGLSHRLHDAIRSHLIRSPWVTKARPVLINNWEATYFNFNEDKLLSIAERARELGTELFVLDDGWFGSRNSDTSSLGDWQEDRNKLPEGLPHLAEKIRGLGLSLGLWIEPEMVSENSELYRNHPDWCLQVPGRKPFRGRDQLNLDITRPVVRDTVMDSICTLIRTCHISYIKWDFNRNIGNVYSAALPADGQGELFHRYVLALYAMQERLVTEFPDLLFENCAGGGGRFDCGMLYYSPQIWCSDNTDAIDRLTIQYGPSFGYPPSCMGAHVSASPNHQTGHSVPFDVRSTVASAGTYGFELDPEKMSEEEKQLAAEGIRRFKETESLVQEGDYYRLTDPMENREHVLWQFVSKDRSRTLAGGVILRSQANPPIRYVRLKGLKKESLYRDTVSGKCYTGAALMYAGIPLPVTAGDYRPVRLLLKEEQ